MIKLSFLQFLLGMALVPVAVSCGKGPSTLLRQGQLPLFDFPLYLSQGAPGEIWSYDRHGERELLIDGLDNPTSIATDKFGNLFVIEAGQSRLVKIDIGTKKKTVIREELENAVYVAVNSFGTPYICEYDTKRVIRATDGKILKEFTAGPPTAMAFGVDDIPLIAFQTLDKIIWGLDEDGESATLEEPVGLSIDGTGRVYATEGTFNPTPDARVYRYQQRKSGGEPTVIADQLKGILGVAVDPVGNVFMVDSGGLRIVVANINNNTLSNFTGTTPLQDPQFLAFTQY